MRRSHTVSPVKRRSSTSYAVALEAKNSSMAACEPQWSNVKKPGCVSYAAQQLYPYELRGAAEEPRPFPIRPVGRHKFCLTLCLNLVLPHHDVGALENLGERDFSSRHIFSKTWCATRAALVPPGTDKARAPGHGQNQPAPGRPQPCRHPAIRVPAVLQNPAP